MDPGINKIKPGLIYFFLLGGWCMVLAFNLSANWDLVGYVGCIIEMEEKNIDSIHYQTFAILEEGLPADDYTELISGNAFKIANKTDPDRFYSTLPFYRVKPLYVYSAYCLYKLGLPLRWALAVVPLLSFFVLGLISFHWIKKYLPGVISFLLALVIIFLGPLSESGRMASPDALSGLFLFYVGYLFLEKRHSPKFWLYVLLLGACWVRIENAIFAILVTLFLIFRHTEGRGKLEWKWAWVWIVSFLLSAFCMPVLLGNDWDWFRDISQFRSSASYWLQMINAIRLSQVAMILIPCIFLFPMINKKEDEPWLALLSLFLFSLLLRLLITPYFQDRYVTGFYLILIVFLSRLSRRLPYFSRF